MAELCEQVTDPFHQSLVLIETPALLGVVITKVGVQIQILVLLKFDWVWLPGIKLIICHEEKDQTLIKQQKQSLQFIKYISFHKIMSPLNYY